MSTKSGSTRNFISLQNKYDRVVLLVDMDCFYCQVEEKLNPEYKGLPLAVVQYNAWRGGGIIAVNYAAREKGVTRHMRGDQAKEQCPDIILAKVPNVREKADLSKYRDAGKEVANVLQRFTQLLERASVDEAYLDITESVNKRLDEMNAGAFVLQPQELVNTFAVGYPNIGEYVSTITARFANPYIDDVSYELVHHRNDLPAVRQSDIKLLIGASIASEIRAAVKSSTGYECSAGIAHNKILAKLACGMNKPNKQTVLPLNQIPQLFETLPVGKITGLGAKFGEEVCERLNIRFLGQILKFTEADLQKKFDEKNGSWLYYMCRGIDLEAITPRFYSKSIGCCKKFPGRNNITGLNTLKHWLNELATEINERLEKDAIENNRKAKQVVVNYIQEFDGEEISSSRSASLSSHDTDTLAKNALEVIKANTKTFFRAGSETVLNNPIKFLGISVGKFETITNAQNKLQEMFANQAAKKRRISEEATVVEMKKQPIADENAEKPIPKSEEKMKSFFANYLQNGSKIRNDAAKDETIIESNRSEKNDSVNIQRPEIKSFFLNALKKKPEPLVAVQAETHELKDEEVFELNTHQPLISENLSKEDAKKPEHRSFFVNALRKQKLEKNDKKISTTESSFQLQNKTEQNPNASEAPIDEIQSLEDELQLIDKQNIQFEQVFDQILTSTESKPELSSESTLKRKIDYKADYAEFAIPEFRADLLKFIKCDKCDADVPDDERSLQTHRDHHFAQELSQQQRNDYRTEIKSKPIAKKSPPPICNDNKTNKKKNRNSTSSTVSNNTDKTNIKKFLKSKDLVAPLPLSLEPSTSAAAEPLEICNECQSYVKLSELPEHMDYHVAKQLQRKLNQLEVRTVAIVKKTNGKKQLNSTTILNGTTGDANKSIMQFFTQPNC